MMTGRNTRFSPLCFFMYALAATALLGSCHTAEKAMKRPEKAAPAKTHPSLSARVVSPETIREKLHENTIQYKTFSARARLDIAGARGEQKGITTFIRMQKDSAIWISVRPVFGIELVRVLITPDSVKMINFLKKSVTLRSADSMQKLLDIPCDFNALQNLIAGNPLFPTDELQDIHTDSSGALIAFSCRQENLRSSYLLHAGSYLLRQYKLAETGGEPGVRYSNETFDAYKLTDDRHFSTERHLVIHTGTETTVDIKFNRVEFDQPLGFPFPVTDKFSRE